MKKFFQGIIAFFMTVIFFTATIAVTNVKADTIANKNMKEVKISKAEKENLDTFFSNFSEISLEKFSELNVKNETLLRFGIYHNWINNSKLFKIDGNYGTISEKNVLDSIYKYFGIKVNISSTIKSKFGYKAGKYKIKCSSGEAFRFSQLDMIYSLGNNYYTCYISVYCASSGFTGNIHKSIAELNKDKDEANHVELDEKIVAKLKKVNQNGKYRYILLSYEKIKNETSNKTVINKAVGENAVGFLALGVKDKVVIKNIGEPEKKSSILLWGADGLKHQTWTYNKKGIELDMILTEKEQAVNSITVKNPCNYKTNKGIGIESKRSEVMDLYKDKINKEESSDNQIVVGSIFGGTIFDIENDKVVSIFIGAAAE